MKKRVLLLIVLTATVLLTGCSGGAPKGGQGTLTIAASEPATLDPHRALTRRDTLYAGHLYEALLAPVGLAADQFEPAGAASYRVGSETIGTSEYPSYTFVLRSSGWSDNQPVVADHYVYGIRRFFNPATDAPMAASLAPFIYNAQAVLNGDIPVEELGVSAAEDGTLKIILQQPVPFAEQLFATTAFAPLRQDIIEAGGEDWGIKPEFIVTNGMYSVESWSSGESLTMTLNNRNWNQGYIHNGKLTWNFMDDTAALSSVRAGTAQAAVSCPPADKIAASAENLLHQQNVRGSAAVLFNTTKTPFNDVRVRAAFSLAVEPASIADAVGVSPSTSLYGFENASAGFAAYDITQAAASLKSAGFRNGAAFPPVTLLHLNDAEAQAAANRLAEAWSEALQVEITLRGASAAEYSDLIQSGEYDLLLYDIIAVCDNPLTVLLPFLSGNIQGYSNAELDAEIAEALENDPTLQSSDLYAEAKSILREDHIVLPLYPLKNELLYYSEDVSQVRAGEGGQIFFDKAYATKPVALEDNQAQD